MRKAKPLERSPSYSIGNAGGGGRPVGEDQTGMMSMGEIFGGVGGGCCSVINHSNFRKPLSTISILCSLLASLARESIMACSNAVKWSLSELGTCCCAGFMFKGRTEGEFQMKEFCGASTGQSQSPDQVVVWSELRAIWDQPSREILF